MEKIFNEYLEQLNSFISYSESICELLNDDKYDSSEEVGKLLTLIDPIFNTDKILQDSLREWKDKCSNENLLQSTSDRNLEIDRRLDELVEEFYLAILTSQKELQNQKDHLDMLLGMERNLPLNILELAQFTQRIAITSGPPKGWTPEDPLFCNRPPYPTEDLMRRTLLFRDMLPTQHLAPLLNNNSIPVLQGDVDVIVESKNSSYIASPESQSMPVADDMETMNISNSSEFDEEDEENLAFALNLDLE